ncbi:hypothetical protein LTR36_008214 [Oleoguttula mirabilis]|uniref:Uncharacterized protein n=1 Tax=Oleoguttula mirabilis TaxID=1507867 RepID=A0AAV9J7U5_9PEZI|nr:hypothetical protein LTR36_008214 [Oleoguttula mirabilis]
MATKRRVTAEESLPARHPPPWSTRNEAYWLLLTLRNPLPAGIYDPLEASHPACTTSGFKGGLGMVQIVRYTDTPCGSYDELLIIPGNFEVPGGSLKGKSRMRISRIYVSQQETMYNGRKNWNIPKHLARFEFSCELVAKGGKPSSQLTVSVFPSESPAANAPETVVPFFHATLKPMNYVPAFPYPTKWTAALLSTTFVQPPLPTGEDELMCGTQSWKIFDAVAATPKARIIWVEASGDDAVDRQGHWPDVKPWSIGLWLEDATLDIPAPEEWRE